jgi:hypothetical protein
MVLARSEVFAFPLLNRGVPFEIVEIVRVQTFVLAIQLNSTLFSALMMVSMSSLIIKLTPKSASSQNCSEDYYPHS